jgi:hypothetical protein
MKLNVVNFTIHPKENNQLLISRIRSLMLLLNYDMLYLVPIPLP